MQTYLVNVMIQLQVEAPGVSEAKDLVNDLTQDCFEIIDHEIVDVEELN